MITTTVVGTKETIRTLSKIDPSMRRRFRQEANKIVKPLIDEAKNNYQNEYLSGMSRNWTQRGKQIFPYDPQQAKKGIKLKVSTAKKNNSLLSVVQQNIAASVIEKAGKANRTARGQVFDRNLTAKSRPAMRVMWPAAESNKDTVQSNVSQLVRRTENELNNQIQRRK